MLDLKELYPDQLSESCFVDAVYDNSSAVGPRGVFVALRGERTDGHKYVQRAFDNGASVAIVEAIDTTITGTQIVVPDTHKAVSQISAKLHPWSKPMRIIGVTGTDGKTSTAVFIEHLLTRLGKSVGYIGTNGISYAGKAEDFKGTTPQPVKLFPILAEMSKHDVDIVVMEVSSHALEGQRVADITFDYAVFTNFSRDHLDYHKTLEAYKLAKLSLFTQLPAEGVTVVNIDDAIALEVIMASEGHKVVTYGMDSVRADLRADDVSYTKTGMRFTLYDKKDEIEVQTRLIGTFNVYNILAAIAIAQNMGYLVSDIVAEIEEIPPIEGRMELFYDEKRDFTVIVDFAHAPNAIVSVLQVARSLGKGKLIVVTGAVGDGDKEKRPLMADAALAYADTVILTTDEPYSEDPEAIIAEMSAHLNDDTYEVIVDRETAITTALDCAGEGDIVAILGRGRQAEITYKDKVISFNDYEFVKQYIEGDNDGV